MQWRAAFTITCCFGIGPLIATARPVAAQTTRVRCESMGNNRAQCSVARDVRVALARQLSDAPLPRERDLGHGGWVHLGLGRLSG
jgi:hypothetical protein